jgi:hypothetical protein
MVTKAARKDAARGQRESPAEDTGAHPTAHFGRIRIPLVAIVTVGMNVICEQSTEVEGGQLPQTTGFAGSHD